MQIYLDYSATTPPRPEAIDLITQVLNNQWGNPSSIHQWGERASYYIEQARFQVASLIRGNPDGVIFTSGGTEANNMAILGVANNYHTPQHIIISSVEHSAISQPVQQLISKGWEVTQLPVSQEGRVNPEDLTRAIRSTTVLVSVIHGQSEIGTVQPIAQIAKICQQHNILFHSDAVQTAGRIPIDVTELGIDLLSLSSHKIYGPQGVGALYIRPDVKITPLITGGGQEMGWRSGTQPVAIISGFGIAAELALIELNNENTRLTQLRQHLFNSLSDHPWLKITGSVKHRLPHHLSFIINAPINCNITGKTIVRQLNLAGIGISAGAACSSGKLNPSPILLAMGYSEQEALRGIRITLGKQTTLEDIDWAAIAIKQVLGRFCPELVGV